MRKNLFDYFLQQTDCKMERSDLERSDLEQSDYGTKRPDVKEFTLVCFMVNLPFVPNLNGFSFLF